MEQQPNFRSVQPGLYVPEQLQTAPTSGILAAWQRYLYENNIDTDKPPPVREPRVSKGKRPTAPWHWMRTQWAKDWRKRRQERLVQDMRESRAGVVTFMTLAEYAIALAASTEPNRDIRLTKRRDMINKWRTYRSKILKIARS